MTGIADLFRYLSMNALGVFFVCPLVAFRALGLQSETMRNLRLTRNGDDALMTRDATDPILRVTRICESLGVDKSILALAGHEVAVPMTGNAVVIGWNVRVTWALGLDQHQQKSKAHHRRNCG